ncbi:MAG: hypothetical protein ACLF0P_12820 [Thermoanaerobaculia bacterium]
MSSFGQVKLKKVWKMLDRCAPGYEAVEQGHLWRVMYKDKTFPALQLGKRSSKTPEVELGNVQKMVKHLGVDPWCAWRHLPQLNKPKSGNK